MFWLFPNSNVWKLNLNKFSLKWDCWRQDDVSVVFLATSSSLPACSPCRRQNHARFWTWHDMGWLTACMASLSTSWTLEFGVWTHECHLNPPFSPRGRRGRRRGNFQIHRAWSFNPKFTASITCWLPCASFGPPPSLCHPPEHPVHRRLLHGRQERRRELGPRVELQPWGFIPNHLAR